MTKLMKGRNAAYYLYFVVLCAIFGVWTTGNFINGRLAQLPVRELQQVPVKQVTTDTKSFYPIWAKTAAAVKADAVAAGDVDEIFKKKEDAKPASEVPRVVEPDYPALVRQAAALQSVADNGAVINGRFYSVGASIDALMVMRTAGQPLVPILAAVQGETVTLTVGKAKVVLNLPKGP